MSIDTLPTYYDDLNASYDEAWTLLIRGKADRRSAFHTPSVATVDTDGYPQVRTVVLRAADKTSAELRFHTDLRARKLVEIAEQPCVSLHFYDKKAKIQLRATGLAKAHTSGFVKEAAWENTRAMSRECYRVDKSPGSFVDASDDWVIPQDPPDADMGKEHFVPVVVKVRSIEWLYLARGGHRRALFDLDEHGALASARWMVP
ncbi:MAG: pyridoxamine 5'-phosphate oxidase family protein [Pseudomonadota bacterium]